MVISFLQKEKILFEKKTDFNDIKVTRYGSTVILYSNFNIRQTQIDLKNPFFPALEYARNTILCLLFFPNPEAILILGLGGGSIPMMMQSVYKETDIDIVEIDPTMFFVAQEYFHCSPSKRLQVLIDDASMYIEKTKKHYDMIIMDAYFGDKQPKSLTNLDFLQKLKTRLSPNGLLISNLMTGNRAAYEDMTRKIGFLFPEVWLLPGDVSSNVLAFACQQSISKGKLIENSFHMQGIVPFDLNLANLAKRLEKWVIKDKEDDIS